MSNQFDRHRSPDEITDGYKSIVELDAVSSPRLLWTELKSFRCLEWRINRKEICLSYGISIIVGLVIAIFSTLSPLAPTELADQFRQLIALVFQYLVTILGIILLGFTVLPSISRESFLCALAEKRNEETKILWGRYIFLNFVNAFAFFLNLSVISVFFYLVGQKGGAASTFVNLLASPGFSNDKAKKMLIAVAYFVIVAGLVLSISKLRNFIFNLYRVIMFILGFILAEELKVDEEFLAVNQKKDSDYLGV